MDYSWKAERMRLNPPYSAMTIITVTSYNESSCQRQYEKKISLLVVLWTPGIVYRWDNFDLAAWRFRRISLAFCVWGSAVAAFLGNNPFGSICTCGLSIVDCFDPPGLSCWKTTGKGSALAPESCSALCWAHRPLHPVDGPPPIQCGKPW